MKTKLLLAAAALIGSLGTPHLAHAREVRVHAFDCKTFGGRPIDSGFALQNDSSSEPMSVVCPIPDSSSFPKTSIKTLNLHGFDNASPLPGEVISGVRAHLCTAAWYTSGGSCSGFQYGGGGFPGEYAISLLPYQNGWTSANFADFGYVRIVLPAKNSNWRATFRGYFISDQPPF